MNRSPASNRASASAGDSHSKLMVSPPSSVCVCVVINSSVRQFNEAHPTFPTGVQECAVSSPVAPVSGSTSMVCDSAT